MNLVLTLARPPLLHPNHRHHHQLKTERLQQQHQGRMTEDVTSAIEQFVCASAEILVPMHVLCQIFLLSQTTRLEKRETTYKGKPFIQILLIVDVLRLELSPEYIAQYMPQLGTPPPFIISGLHNVKYEIYCGKTCASNWECVYQGWRNVFQKATAAGKLMYFRCSPQDIYESLPGQYKVAITKDNDPSSLYTHIVDMWNYAGKYQPIVSGHTTFPWKVT